MRYEVLYRCTACHRIEVHCGITIPGGSNLIEPSVGQLQIAMADYDRDVKKTQRYHTCYSREDEASQMGKLEFAGLRKEV